MQHFSKVGAHCFSKNHLVRKGSNDFGVLKCAVSRRKDNERAPEHAVRTTTRACPTRARKLGGGPTPAFRRGATFLLTILVVEIVGQKMRKPVKHQPFRNTARAHHSGVSGLPR